MRRTRCLILWEKHFSAANLKIKLLTYVWWTHSVRQTYILMLLPLVLRAIKNNIHICAKMQHLSVQLCTLSQCVCEQDVWCYDDFPPRATSLRFLNVSPPTSFEHFFLIITIIIAGIVCLIQLLSDTFSSPTFCVSLSVLGIILFIISIITLFHSMFLP